MKITDRTIVLFIALIIVIVFSHSLKSDFAWDDKFLIINNPYVKDFNCLSRMFSCQLYRGGEMDSNFYRPLQLISFAIDYSIWKLKPFGYHLTSLLLHVTNAVLLYFIILAITSSSYMAAITTLFFGLSPAISSTTYYIAARSDLLMALFVFLSILLFIKYRQEGKKILYIVSIISFLFSLLCKEMAIMLPLLLYLELTRDPDKRKGTARVLSPYIIILLIYILLRASVLNFAKGQNSLIDMSFPATIPLYLRILTDFKVLLLYLKALLFPVGLHIDYFVRPARGIFQIETLVAIALVALIVAGIKKISRRNKLILFGALWFLFSLLPVLNIYPISVFFGEGWLYVPCVGIFIILSVIFKDIIRPKIGFALSNILIALLLSCYALCTVFYGNTWKDSISIFNNVLKYEKDSFFIYLTHNNMGMAYQGKGDLDKAIYHFKKSVSLNPTYADGYNNLGVAYAAKGMPVKAIKLFKKAISLKKHYISAYCNLGHVYCAIGLKERAIYYSQTAISMNPYAYSAYCNLGYIYSDSRDIDKAIYFFKKAIQSKREDYEAHYCLGSLYAKKNDYKAALAEYKEALRFGLGGTDFYNASAFVYIKDKKFKEAELALIRSAELDSSQFEPHNNLGNLYSMFGYFDAAIEEYGKAFAVKPGDTGIIDNIKKTKAKWKKAMSVTCPAASAGQMSRRRSGTGVKGP